MKKFNPKTIWEKEIKSTWYSITNVVAQTWIDCIRDIDSLFYLQECIKSFGCCESVKLRVRLGDYFMPKMFILYGYIQDEMDATYLEKLMQPIFLNTNSVGCLDSFDVYSYLL